MKRWSPLILAAIMLLGAALRCWHIGQASYWYDEFCSLEDSAGNGVSHFHLPRQQILRSPPDLLSLPAAKPVWHIWTSMGSDVHPPLYFILLRLWRDLFGTTEAITRSLSALSGIASILCIYDVGRLAHGRGAGIWAATIFAVAGPQVIYAQETRGYTLVVLLGLCMLDALVRIEMLGVNRARLVVLGAAELAMMLTHYLGIPLAISLGIYVLIRLRGTARWKTAATMVIAAAIFLAIWGPFFIEQRHNVGPAKIGFLYEGEWSKWYSLQRLASLPLVLLGPPLNRTDISNYLPAIVYLLPLLGPPLHGMDVSNYLPAIVYLLPLLMLRKNPLLLLWLFWLLGTAGFLGVLDRLNPSHELSTTRYILICGPGFYLIFAGALAQGGRLSNQWWMQHILPALAVVFCLVSLSASYAERRWPDWRAITSAIDRMREPNDLLVFASDGKDDWFSGEYMSYAYYAQQYPKNIVILPAPANAQLLEQMQQFAGAIIVNGTNRPPDASLPGYHIIRAAPFLPFLTADRMEENAELKYK